MRFSTTGSFFPKKRCSQQFGFWGQWIVVRDNREDTRVCHGKIDGKSMVSYDFPLNQSIGSAVPPVSPVIFDQRQASQERQQLLEEELRRLQRENGTLKTDLASSKDGTGAGSKSQHFLEVLGGDDPLKSMFFDGNPLKSPFFFIVRMC
jgi:hypothetical protein